MHYNTLPTGVEKMSPGQADPGSYPANIATNEGLEYENRLESTRIR